MKEIKILGAGLSGLTAAINLAKNGYDVRVYEKNRDVGLRFNGDIQGLENWSEKEDIIQQIKSMGIKINFDCDPFLYIDFSDTKRTSRLLTKRPLYYLIKRGNFVGTLDYGMKKQAIQAGVKIRYKETIPEKEADIIATGPILKKIPCVAKGIVFKTRHEDIAELVFHDKLAFCGYSYLLITKGNGCMCSVVLREKTRVNECFKKSREYFIRKYSIDIKQEKNAGGIGCFSTRQIFERQYGKHKVLYAGEAAGLQDFLWGFGMRYAFESGYLAAKSIIEGMNYKKLAENAFKNKLRASIVNRYLWERYNRRLYQFIIKNPELTRSMLYSMHNFNPVQRSIYPFAKSYTNKRYPQLRV